MASKVKKSFKNLFGASRAFSNIGEFKKGSILFKTVDTL